MKVNGYSFQDEILKIELSVCKGLSFLSALDDVLESLDITHLITYMSTDDVVKIEHPFLMIDTNTSNTISLVDQIKEDSFSIIGIKSKRQNILKTELLDTNAIIFVLIEPQNISFLTQLRNQIISKSYLLVCLLIVVTLILQGSWSNKYLFLYSSLTLSGLLLGYLTVPIENGNSPTLVNKLCGIDSNDCNSVLNSNQAFLFKYLKLSDLVVIYFGSLMLYLILIQPIAISPILSYLVMACIPLIAYSIWTQIKIMKWCKICLMILIVLVAMIIIVSLDGSFNYPSWKDICMITLIAITSATLWIKKKKETYLSNNSILLQNNLHSFRRNLDFFQGHLNIQNSIDLPSIDNMLIQQYSSGLWTITMFLQFSCSMCDAVLKMLLHLQEEIGCFKSIKVVIINNNTSGAYDNDKRVIDNLLELSIADKDWLNPLNEWLSTKDFGKWSDKYLETKFTQDLALRESNITEWLVKNKLLHTPFLLLDNKLISNLYLPLDLKILLKNLFSYSQKQDILDHYVK